MKHTFLKLRKTHYSITASVLTALALAQPANAQTAGDTAENLIGQLGSIGKLMTAGAFVGGIVMLGSGLMKLKQAAETQGQQVKYSEGMWRIGVGAALIALPAFATMVTQTGDWGPVNITPGGGSSF